MTNTLFFHTIVRDYTDDESVSTCTENEDAQVVEVEASTSTSLYTAIRKACLGFRKPPITLLQQRNSTTPAAWSPPPIELLQLDSITSPAATSWSPPISDQGPRNFSRPRRELSYATPQSTILRSFDFKELEKATIKFSLVNVLGQGGFGPVFKGWINAERLTSAMPGTGVPVAVKRLNVKGSEGYKEWLTEAKYLGKLYHPNLVTLLGYACYDEDRLLVYEFVPQGSLDNHLFRRGSHYHFSWRLRMKVALEAAKALAYLHSEKTMHQDFTSSNILLDSKYNVKLSDFGCAMDVLTDEMSSDFTRMGGTYGFAADEHDCTGCLTPKADVFSFGVVLLELLSGERVLDSDRPSRSWPQPQSEFLAEWVKPYLKNEHNIIHILDFYFMNQYPHLVNQYPLASAQKAMKLAFQCLSALSKFRPSMQEVVLTLEQLQEHP